MSTEKDYRDALISKLKSEIEELRQNERDYINLSRQLELLEKKYNMLCNEKVF